ncbi:MAG: hypothetical protein H6Q33_4356 [Deltaproteobacteria bacterium]|nr:hypothetical protein [Deltaproteobacteria bacterium]
MVGNSPQCWFDGIDVNENALDFLWPLAIWVIGSIGQALQDYGRRRTEQDDVIELWIELDHVLSAATDEEKVNIGRGKEISDSVLSPVPVVTRIRTGGITVCLNPLGPLVAISINGSKAAGGELRDQR